MSALSQVRARTTRALAGLEIPAAFQVATVNAAINATERTSKAAKASRRRLQSKALRLASVEAV